MSFLSGLRHRCSPVNLLHIFRTPFPRSTFEGMLLDINGNASKKKVMERLSLLTIVISMARMAIILKLFSKFTVCLLHIFRTPFFKNTSGGLLLPVEGNGFTRQPNVENILIHTAKTTHATQFHDWYYKNFDIYQIQRRQHKFCSILIQPAHRADNLNS